MFLFCPQLLSLPDDALLAVLAFLPPRELLNCRMVSLCLRDLCLHPHLWRSVKLSHDDYLLRAALRLAPRLRKIGISNPAAVASEVRDTNCVVEALEITVRSSVAAIPARSIIQKLASLGGLRQLKVWLRTKVVQIPLLKVLYGLNDLRKLKMVSWNIMQLPATWCRVKGRPSLTELGYSMRCCDPFLELLLTTHAPTLEVVKIITDYELPIELLARLPRLRSLTCRLGDDELFPLAALPNLASVTFTNVSDSFPHGVVKYLRHALQLRSVSFIMPNKDPAAPLLALGDSPSARHIKTLYLENASGEVVAASLHKFPGLQSLTVTGPYQRRPFQLFDADSFLGAISHAALTSLTLEDYPKRNPKDCFHSWLHGPVVQNLFAVNPYLHLRCERFRPLAPDCGCPWCLRGCHAELSGKRDSAFASHSRRPQCPRDCFQVAAQAP